LYLSNRFILLLGLQNSNSKPAKGTAVQDIRTLAAFNKNITYKFPPPIARNFMFFGLTLKYLLQFQYVKITFLLSSSLNRFISQAKFNLKEAV
jgi:hypothetical protein